MKNPRLIILIILSLSLTVQAQDFEWAKSFGSFFHDKGSSIFVDHVGDVYNIGNFHATVDFDPSTETTYLSSNGSKDVYIQKLDASGNLIWAKSFGGGSSETGTSLNVDLLGNIYITGNFSGIVDFNPGIGVTNANSNGSRDVYVLKLDSNADFLWVKTFGGTGSETSTSLAIDEFGNLIITGSFEDTVDFDPGVGNSIHTSNGETDCFIQKLDASGNFVWAKTFGSSQDDNAQSVSTDLIGNIYTLGSFKYFIDLDPGTGTFHQTTVIDKSNIFIQKLDPSGNFIWAKSIGSSGIDLAGEVKVDANNNVYLSGNFNGNVNFGTTFNTFYLSSNEHADNFIQKLDSSGNSIWAKSFGGPGYDIVRSIIVDTLGNIYSCGEFRDTVDFDPGFGTTTVISNGLSDAFVQKLDSNGNFVWVKNFGSTGSDSGSSIDIDKFGNLYTTGDFKNTIEFPLLTDTTVIFSIGNSDIYVQRISQCQPNTGTDIITACNSFTWIDGNTYTTNNNTAKHTIIGGSINSCDSIVSLDLIIHSVDITTIQSGSTLTANNTGASYQWLDCDNNYAPISGATGSSFTATLIGNYAVELTENGCVDTSACVAVTTVGVIENTFGDAFAVYPNPTKGAFSVNLGTHYELIKISISDFTGRLLQHAEHNKAQQLDLNIPESSGVYLLTVEAGDQKAVIRLVKE